MEAVQWIISAGTNIQEANQLGEDLSRLRASLPKARLLINRADWGRFKNKELAELLSQLKDTAYDAEDLLRHFQDQDLRRRMEDAHRSRAGQLFYHSLQVAKDLIIGTKKRLIETQGKLDKAVADMEGVLSILGLSVEQVQLMPETSSVVSAPEVVGRDKERDELIDMLGVTIGRESEQDQVIELLGVPLTRNRGERSARASGKRAAVGSAIASTSRAKQLKGKNCRARATPSDAKDSTGNVSVLAIVGIGGVGKTTLAQFIYNDARVRAHFDAAHFDGRIWVCVSDLFDKKRITKEIIKSIPAEEIKVSGSLNVLQEEPKRIIKSIPGEEINISDSLNVLQEELKKRIKRQKLLLVLDDIWPNANNDWEAFYAPLRHGLEGTMVLVTTRFPKVANFVATVEPIELHGLPTDIFREFFKKCAFGKEHPESYPQLQDISQIIADRLCGSPLAAKTLGRLLNMELSEQHWRTIQNSELWELPHEDNEILPALQFSYLYLPQELKRCFAFCSVFPKDYSFERDEIVDVWVAQGFVASGGSMRLEDTGSRYLDDLRSRFLFQTDPKFPKGSRYVMHDLIHDMAQSVSLDECFLMQDLRYQNNGRMPHTVRHMSIEFEVNNESVSRMAGLHIFHNKLRSLRFGTRIEAGIPWFNQLSNILFLSLKGCTMEKLPESLCKLTSLRFLDISHSRIQELPEKFWCLYSLQFMYANNSRLRKIRQGVVKLTNLCRLALEPIASEDLSRKSGLGNLSSLRNLRRFEVGRKDGRGIGELKGMNQLSGALSIKWVQNVRSRAAAAEARLVDKHYLKELVLHWRDNQRVVGAHTLPHDNGVMEGLHPPSRIESLTIQGFWGDICPSWFRAENLPALRSLKLLRCRCLKAVAAQFPCLERLVVDSCGVEALTAFADGSTGDDRMMMMQHASSSSSSNAYPPLPRLTDLLIYGCLNLSNLDQFLSPEYLPSIKSIEIVCCQNLVSLPVHDFVGFLHLQDLKMEYLHNLNCPREREMVLPRSLRRLSIIACPGLEESLPSCLRNLSSLTLLHLAHCLKVTSIPLSPMGTDKLKYLLLHNCTELSSIGGGQDAVSAVQYVRIFGCPKLAEEGIQQPFKKGELRAKEKRETSEFVGEQFANFIT